MSASIKWAATGAAALLLAGCAGTAAAPAGMHPAHLPPAASAIPAKAPPTPASHPAVGVAGEAVTVRHNYQGAAEVAITKIMVTTHHAQYGEPPRHGYYVIAHVHVAALTAGELGGFDVDPADFHAQTPTGQVDQGNGNSMPSAPGNNRNLFPAVLKPSKTMDGTIVFDVTGPHGLILYGPFYDGRIIAEWRY